MYTAVQGSPIVVVEQYSIRGDVYFTVRLKKDGTLIYRVPFYLISQWLRREKKSDVS